MANMLGEISVYVEYLLMRLFVGPTGESGVHWPCLLEDCRTDTSISGAELTTDVFVKAILSAARLFTYCSWPKQRDGNQEASV
jgi:hypothetical protein